MASAAHHPIFLITHEFYPRRGGIATFAEEIARAATALGYDLEVWAQTSPAGSEKTWPFRLRRLPLKGTHDLSCQLRLAREFITHRRRLRHAIVHLAEPGPMLAMMLLQNFKTFRPQRLVLTFHGSEIIKFHRHPATRLMARRLIRHADRISVLSQFTHDLLLARFPEAAGKTVITPGALRSDFAAVHPAPPARRPKTIILTVGRLHPRKGQMMVLAALSALPPAVRAGIEYWLVGSTSKTRYEATLRTAAAHAGFPVKFLGDVSDQELDNVYDQADIFAMTSVNLADSIEGFGLVYLEASAHGLPIVAHAVGGVPEAVVDGVTGLLVPPHQPQLLTAALARLIADPALRRQYGSAGAEWARRYTWKQSAQALFAPAGSRALS